MIKQYINKFKNAYFSKKYSVTSQDYDASKYWSERHDVYDTETLKGVGNGDKSESENYEEYKIARLVFLDLLDKLNLLNPKEVLELGYGTGFYTKIIDMLSVNKYTGIDITDTHKDNILQSLGDGFTLLKGDISLYNTHLPNKCDLIYMIDVAQHIVNDTKLDFCLTNNVQANMKLGGIFIVTDELNNKKFSFYEKSRDIEYYQNILDKCELIESPILFRDKYIFAFKRVR